MARVKLSRKTKHDVLYASAYVCVVCQNADCQIHHIDRNSSNNDMSNLVLLCQKHHSEAHTNRSMGVNLTPELLKKTRKEWLLLVERKRNTVVSASKQNNDLGGSNWFGLHSVSWGYINHHRVSEMGVPDRLQAEDKAIFDYCVNQGLIDDSGILIKPRKVEGNWTSIYDWYEYGDRHRLHKAFGYLVDQVATSYPIVHIEPSGWNKTHLSTIDLGSLLFVNRGFFFKKVKANENNEHRRCRAFRRKIEIEFFVDTQDMFGDTSINTSFSGHTTCASLLLLKSRKKQEDNTLILQCTPLALGVGFSAMSSILS